MIGPAYDKFGGPPARSPVVWNATPCWRGSKRPSPSGQLNSASGFPRAPHTANPARFRFQDIRDGLHPREPARFGGRHEGRCLLQKRYPRRPAIRGCRRIRPVIPGGVSYPCRGDQHRGWRHPEPLGRRPDPHATHRRLSSRGRNHRGRLGSHTPQGRPEGRHGKRRRLSRRTAFGPGAQRLADP